MTNLHCCVLQSAPLHWFSLPARQVPLVFPGGKLLLLKHNLFWVAFQPPSKQFTHSPLHFYVPVQPAVGAAESTAREFATLSKVHDHNPGHSVAKPFETKQIQLSIWRRFISTGTKLSYSSSTPTMCRREALELHCSGLQPAAAPQYCTSPAVLGELPLLCTFSERAQNTSLWRKSYP